MTEPTGEIRQHIVEPPVEQTGGPIEASHSLRNRGIAAAAAGSVLVAGVGAYVWHERSQGDDTGENASSDALQCNDQGYEIDGHGVIFYMEHAVNYPNSHRFGPEIPSDNPQATLDEIFVRQVCDPTLTTSHQTFLGLVDAPTPEARDGVVSTYINDKEKRDDANAELRWVMSQAKVKEIVNRSGNYWTQYQVGGPNDRPEIFQSKEHVVNGKFLRLVLEVPGPNNTTVDKEFLFKLDCGAQPAQFEEFPGMPHLPEHPVEHPIKHPRPRTPQTTTTTTTRPGVTTTTLPGTTTTTTQPTYYTPPTTTPPKVIAPTPGPGGSTPTTQPNAEVTEGPGGSPTTTSTTVAPERRPEAPSTTTTVAPGNGDHSDPGGEFNG